MLVARGYAIFIIFNHVNYNKIMITNYNITSPPFFRLRRHPPGQNLRAA